MKLNREIQILILKTAILAYKQPSWPVNQWCMDKPE